MAHKTILHIEDDPSLANLVKLTFESFGFKGEILHAPLVTEAFSLLVEREHKKLPVDLILTDMRLPDGRGLELLQYVRANPTWSKTPVIILSSESSPEIISESYALGANCYLSKLPRPGLALEHFRSLYQFWIERAFLPETSFLCGIQGIFRKSAQLRARTANFYIELSKAAVATSEQESFWLERAMLEGNLSSLMIFLHDLAKDSDVPFELTERFSQMQIQIELALTRAEQAKRNGVDTEKIAVCRSVLGLVDAYDEEAIAELFGFVFPMNQTATKALLSRAASHFEEIANYVLTETHDSDLVERAKLLQKLSGRLGRMLVDA